MGILLKKYDQCVKIHRFVTSNLPNIYLRMIDYLHFNIYIFLINILFRIRNSLQVDLLIYSKNSLVVRISHIYFVYNRENNSSILFQYSYNSIIETYFGFPKNINKRSTNQINPKYIILNHKYMYLMNLVNK